jgi:ABC-2 type transport system permease protein
LQSVAKSLPLVYIFEEVRNILIYQTYTVINIFKATMITFLYFATAIFTFHIAFEKSRERGTLMNMGE